MLPGRSRTSVLVFLVPPLLLYLVAVALPIVQSLVLSFFSWDGVTDLRLVGFSNYVKMFTADPIFWRAFANTMVYLAVCLFFQLGVSLFVANLLSYAGRGKEVAKTLYLLPAIHLDGGDLVPLPEDLLLRAGRPDQPVARRRRTRRPGRTVVVAGEHGPGGGVRPGGLAVHRPVHADSLRRDPGRPKELEEAARLDGASTWQIFAHVRFPYIRPVWVTTMIMAATYSLRGFDIPYLLTNGGPGQASELLTTYMFKTAFRSTDFGYASSIAVFIVIECVVAVGLILLLLRRGRENA